MKRFPGAPRSESFFLFMVKLGLMILTFSRAGFARDPSEMKEEAALSQPQEAEPEAESSPAAADASSQPQKPKATRPVRIKRIQIEGCRQIRCRTVKSILKEEPTPWWKRRIKRGGYDPFWAGDDRRRIELFYRSRGFYSVRVEGPEVERGRRGKGVKLRYGVEEGKPVRVAKIEIALLDAPEEDLPKLRARLGYQEGDRFESEPYQEAGEAMQHYYQDKGFFRVEVERKAGVDPEAGVAEVGYAITRGNWYRIRKIQVEGTKRTQPKVVRRALTLKAGERYSRKKIIDNQRQVQRLPIYRSVRVVEQGDDEARKVDLTIRVEEGKPREVNVGLGYGSEEGVRVQGSWRHVNFLGGARELSVTARWSELLEREEVRFVQPNLGRAGNFLSVTAERRVEHEEAYRHEARSLTPTYHFILSRYLWDEASYRIEDNTLSRVLDLLKVKEEDLAREGLLSAVSNRVEWADLDNPIRPQRGARASLYLEAAGGPLGGDFSYFKAISETRGYYPLFTPAVVAAGRCKIGWAEPFGDLERLPLFKRFYTGGTGSVRGFDRYGLGPRDPDGRPIGGTKLWETSAELRLRVYKEWGLVGFLDGGWVWPEHQDYDLRDVVYGAGGGIRYSTPIGPLALDAGVPLTADPRYPDFRIHFNIGNTF